MKGTKIIPIIVFVSILIVGVVLIIKSTEINENIASKKYEFRFNMDIYNYTSNSQPFENFPFNYFAFNYDFSNGLGNISFVLPYDLTPEVIQIWFPMGITVKNISILNCDDRPNYSCLNSNLTYNSNIRINGVGEINKNSTNYFRMNNFLREGLSELVILEFDMERIEPNGVFWMMHDKNSINGKFNFVLGNKYRCLTPCFENIKGTEELVYLDIPSSMNNIRLKMEENTELGIFRINAINYNNRFRHDIYFGLGISIIASALVSIVLIFFGDDKK
ncbi:MAG: hypothetical protein AABX59_02550 [Nanoarchaeota archaeon]